MFPVLLDQSRKDQAEPVEVALQNRTEAANGGELMLITARTCESRWLDSRPSLIDQLVQPVTQR